MRCRRFVVPFVVLCLAIAPSLRAQTAPTKVNGTKDTLSFPIAVKPAGSVVCRVSFGPRVPVSALAFSPDGMTLAVGGYQEVLLWDLHAPALAQRWGAKELGETVHAVAFVGKDRWLAAAGGTAGRSGAVALFDRKTGKQAARFDEPKDVVYALAASPDGKLLAGGGADSAVYVWNVDDKKCVATIDAHDGCVFGVAFSPDGKLLATGGADNTLLVREVGTWTEVARLPQPGVIHGCTFAPDGKLLAVAVAGPEEWAVRVQPKNNPKQSRPIYTGPGMPLDVAWLRKGNRIIVPCSDNTIKAYHGGNRRWLATLSGHTDWVYAAAGSADGTKLASGSADGTVKLWNPANGALLATLVQLAPRAADWLIVTPQGYLATSSFDALQWKTKAKRAAGDELARVLHSAEKVQQTIAGKKVAPPVLP